MIPAHRHAQSFTHAVTHTKAYTHIHTHTQVSLRRLANDSVFISPSGKSASPEDWTGAPRVRLSRASLSPEDWSRTPSDCLSAGKSVSRELDRSSQCLPLPGQVSVSTGLDLSSIHRLSAGRSFHRHRSDRPTLGELHLKYMLRRYFTLFPKSSKD